MLSAGHILIAMDLSKLRKMMDGEGGEPKKVRLPAQNVPPSLETLQNMFNTAKTNVSSAVELMWTSPGARLPFELVVQCDTPQSDPVWIFSEVDGRARDVVWREKTADVQNVCAVVNKLWEALSHAGQAPKAVAAGHEQAEPASLQEEEECESAPEASDGEELPEDEDVLEFLGETVSAVKVLSDQLINPGSGLLSFSTLLKFLEHETRRFHACGSPLSLILFDIRSTSGNSVPGQAVTTAALRLEMVIRQCDLLGHFEGQDIALVLPGTDRTQSVFLANKVLQILTSGPLAPGMGRNALQFAVGIASLPEDGNDLPSLISAVKRSKERARQRALAS
ncbi:MAG TPA: diguanylate cyclase [Candidatus Obscuribacterales bacterium]